jgi:thioredoxin-dependent peroxiredoxin
MTAYRDQYASVFRGGRGVTLIGISQDSPEDLGSWLKDADFPFLFAQDVDGSALAAFGGKIRDNGMTLERAVVVIDPEGKIHEWMTPFREIDPTSYEKLKASIAEVAPDLDEGKDFDSDGVAEALRSMERGDCD